MGCGEASVDGRVYEEGRKTLQGEWSERWQLMSWNGVRKIYVILIIFTYDVGLERFTYFYLVMASRVFLWMVLFSRGSDRPATARRLCSILYGRRLLADGNIHDDEQLPVKCW